LRASPSEAADDIAVDDDGVWDTVEGAIVDWAVNLADVTHDFADFLRRARYP